MSEYEHEPIPGLPGKLPDGETILWQGAPEASRLARSALHVRAVGGYFGVLLVWGLIDASLRQSTLAQAALGMGLLLALAALTVGLLAGFAYLSARTTIYTITNRRVVLRFGVAIQKAINVPFAIIGSANLRSERDGGGDIALQLTGDRVIGYLHLWPHVRPFRMAKPEPMLRALDDASAVAVLLGEALRTYEAAHPAPVADRVERPARAASAAPDRSAPDHGGVAAPAGA